jgi:crossover junction endodeoxyribonuclease RuvC
MSIQREKRPPMISERPLCLGVDPGYTGGIALYDLDQENLVQVIPTPVVKTINSKGRGTTRINIHEFSIWLDAHKDMIRACIIEDVAAMPEQGVVSVFNFGFGAGVLHGVLGAAMIPVFAVKPGVWKANMGLTSNKQLSLERARTFFPQFRDVFSIKKNDGLAEAALMAKYGERIFGKSAPKSLI